MLLTRAHMQQVQTMGPLGFDNEAAAFKAFLATTSGVTNPHSQTVMPVPPTITTDITSVPATLYTRWLSMNAPTELAQVLVENANQFLSSVFLSPQVASMNGSTRIGCSARVSVTINADVIAFYVLGIAGKYRFLVDDRYVDFTGTDAPQAGTGNNYIILTFASKAVRKVTIEMPGNTGLRRIMVKNGDSFGTKPAQKPWRGIMLGDSVAAATGATVPGDGLVQYAADYLGMEIWPSGVGATGYSATSSGTRYKLSERVNADLDAMLATGPIHAVYVAMGLNDLAAQTNVLTDANTTFNLIRTRCPNALVFAINTWDASAPSDPGSTYTDLEAIIRSAASRRPGFYFLDPQGIAYTKPDGDPTHPDTPGHATLGGWLDTTTRAVVI